MQASIKWLKQYVDFTETPEVLAEKLTMAGVPVEGITYLGEGINKVVTGKIVDIQKHPNADKLSICKIDVGTEELIIVTGASNVRVGQVVPVALVGAVLPNGLAIKPSKLRGEMSYGMLCSAAELMIDSKLLSAEEREGIYILPADTPVGEDIKAVLGLDDVVLEFELTANRADCFSILGLAREVAVLTGGTLKKPMLHVKEAHGEKTADLVRVKIQEPSLCGRFTARVLKNVKVGPSPLWLKHRLQAVGMRSINNVVDVTNYVMLEMGQPMHAYDYNLLSRHEIYVRRAQAGERLTTLDDVKRELTTDMLVIADAGQAVGVAGVMGGLATEVTKSTKTVLLEAAAFRSVSVRRTARALGLRSEASGRFERGVDVANIVRALDRAAQLLEEMGACEVCSGIVDVYPEVVLPRQIQFNPAKINAYLGTAIDADVMVDILRKLECTVQPAREAGEYLVTAPTWRGDMQGQADICEEIARIYGFNNIPAKTPSGIMVRGTQAPEQTLVEKTKQLLTGMSFDEIISFSFGHPGAFDKLNMPAEHVLRQTVPVMNPITDDFPILRTSLLPGLLDTVVRNLSRKNEDMKLYEIGAVFHPKALPLAELPVEEMMLCGVMLGKRQALAWNQGRDMVDFYDAKGAVEELLTGLGIAEYQVKAGEHFAMHPGKTAVISCGDKVVATVGELHPQVLAAYGIQRKAYVFELPVNVLAEMTGGLVRYKALPKFPAIARDLAFVAPVKLEAAALEAAIRESAGSLLESICLFDVYAGEQVGEAARSLAFSLIFRHSERTLTDEEVEVSHKNIIAHLEKTFGVELRK